MPGSKSGQVWSALQSDKTLNLYNFLFSKMARGYFERISKSGQVWVRTHVLRKPKFLEFLEVCQEF
jgi:hypothetical protein